MPKLPYLVGRNRTKKFKRNVPKELVSLAGKTAWVERLKGHTAAEIKSQGHIFALTTDAEIERLKRMRQQASNGGREVGSLGLDETAVKLIAFAYFQKRHEANIANGSYFASRADPDFEEILSDASAEYQEATRRVEGEIWEAHFALPKLLLEHGLIDEATAKAAEEVGWPETFENSAGFQSLARRLDLCDQELARLMNVGLRERRLPRSEYLEPGFRSAEEASVKPAHTTGRTIEQLVTEFLAIKKPEVTPSRYNQFKIPSRVLTEQLGAKRLLVSISRSEARELCEFLPRIPAHSTKRYPTLTLEKAAISHERDHGVPANRWEEAKKHLAVINSMFVYARNEAYVDRNQFDGLKIAIPQSMQKKHISKENTYLPFSLDDLNRIFSLPMFARRELGVKHGVLNHLYWAPFIALFSGMRSSEILQLEACDVQEIDGVDFFFVTDQVFGDYPDGTFTKRLKTENCLRKVPVHPVLKAMGFIDQVKLLPDGRVFPLATGWKPSNKFSKQSARFLKKAGVWSLRRKVFHSFRNSFNDALRAADVPLEIREPICGWSEERSMDARYGKGYPIERMADAISRVTYPGLQLPGL